MAYWATKRVKGVQKRARRPRANCTGGIFGGTPHGTTNRGCAENGAAPTCELHSWAIRWGSIRARETCGGCAATGATPTCELHRCDL
eukprot:6787318-Pyramimonas_sp.AAC.1